MAGSCLALSGDPRLNFLLDHQYLLGKHVDCVLVTVMKITDMGIAAHCKFGVATAVVVPIGKR